MQVCRTCGIEKPLAEFYKTRQWYWKDCNKCVYISRKKAETPLQKAARKQSQMNQHRQTKMRLVEAFGNKCAVCGITGHPAIFDFHHRDPESKKKQVGQMGKYAKALIEAQKCDMLCANCHRTLHWSDNSADQNPESN